MNQARLDLTKNGLNLDYLTKDDTVGLLIEKINKNFREINASGGGPIGKPGKKGNTGCPGRTTQGGSGFGGSPDLEFVGNISMGCDLSLTDENNAINDIISNKFTNRTVLLSNLQEITSGGITQLKRNDINEEELTALRVPLDFVDYKLKIYNSDENGLGKHIHFLNSKAASLDNRYFCKSGFTASVNWDGNGIETFKLAAVENAEIANQVQNIELQGDILKLKRNDNSQEFNFESGAKDNSDENNPKRLTMRLVDLTEAQVCSVPDRTGFNAIWQDTLEHSENWEVVLKPEIVINHARYEMNDQMISVPRNGTHMVCMDDNSFIRFKRQNNWVLVDYHIGLYNNCNQYNFYLHNIQIKVDKSTVGCLTAGWHPGTTVTNESYLSEETDNKFSMFKVDSANFENMINNTFMVSLKLTSYNKTFFTEIKDKYWLTGQVWATVQNPECAVISVDVEQTSSCSELNII